MTDFGRLLWLTVGLILGVVGSSLVLWQVKPAQAANDRFEDYIMCTGPVALTGKTPTDGVWLLDYRSGKLLATVIDRTLGKITGWAELDLVAEFGIQPRQNVHFLMTTGTVAAGQAALYVAETTTGKIGVYSMASRNDGQAGISIRKHDLVLFRPAPKGN
jgi:hypothetical protein